jgi:hypothetical protein
MVDKNSNCTIARSEHYRHRTCHRYALFAVDNDLTVSQGIKVLDNAMQAIKDDAARRIEGIKRAAEPVPGRKQERQDANAPVDYIPWTPDAPKPAQCLSAQRFSSVFPASAHSSPLETLDRFARLTRSPQGIIVGAPPRSAAQFSDNLRANENT